MSSSGWVTSHRRLILWVGAGLIIVWYGILLGAYELIPVAKSAMEARAKAMLQAEFAADVHFQSFDIVFFPWIRITAHGVLIGNNAASPLIQADRADAKCDWLPWHIRSLVLNGLVLHVPTVSGAASASQAEGTGVSIAEVVAEHAQVEFLPAADQMPLRIELRALRVKDFNPGHAAAFSASLISSKPNAEIQAQGHLGPWNAEAPSLTPLQGTYTMAHCNLATLPGLKGSLTSQGSYRGVLQRVQITGTADASPFSLSISGHPQPLQASFEATVDAWDDAASIENLKGVLGSSAFAGSGLARNIQDDRFRDLAFDISMNQGRLEDILPLAVKSKTSPVSGAVRVMGAKLEILPGGQDVLNRIIFEGDVAASRARFSSLDLRERLRDVSRKAEGRPDDKASGSSTASIQGHLKLDHGVAEFSNLVLELEDASAHLQGSYQLANERLDLHGQLWMAAKLSQTATGAKAFFLKAVDPFFRGKQGGSLVPVQITGTRSDPRFSLDLVK